MLWINKHPEYGLGLKRYGLVNTVVDVVKSNDKQIDSSGKVVNHCEKSPSFAEAVILSYSDKGDNVLELCGGSGAFSVNALLHGRNAVYVERDSRQVDHVQKLLNALPHLQKKAFLTPYRLPVSELLPTSVAPSTDGTWENPMSFIPWPRPTRDDDWISVLSKGKFAPLLVSQLVFACFCFRRR